LVGWWLWSIVTLRVSTGREIAIDHKTLSCRTAWTINPVVEIASLKAGTGTAHGPFSAPVIRGGYDSSSGR
jgi:hypothetical protein